MRLTDEQRLVVASKSEALRVVAFAGTGKTSTLRAYAEARPDTTFLYLAFNRAIMLEARRKFPGNVTCVTTHSLAYAREGIAFRHKLSKAIRANQAIKVLGYGGDREGLVRGRRALQALTHFLASRYYGFYDFCIAEKEEHRDEALDDAEKLWDAMIDPNNLDMPMLHDGYLKLYQISNPKLRYDCILFDEAQDANPVTLEIVRTQRCSKVFVGDAHQQIYQFRRATNAMDDPLLSDTLYLTQSFRFGEPIASVANDILTLKRETKHVRGHRTTPASDTKVFLARGNAAVFSRAASMAKGRGVGVHFVGGIDGYRLDQLLDVWFLWQNDKEQIRDPFIRHFDDYDDLASYADSQNERDLMAWVNLIANHAQPKSIPQEISEVQRLCVKDAVQAELCVATAHKSKGLEFGVVEIASDFPKPKIIECPSWNDFNPKNWHFGPQRCPLLWSGERFKGGIVFPVEEINLRYVAATRAERMLQASAWRAELADILAYIKRHPDFVLADGEADFAKGERTSNNLQESGRLGTLQIEPEIDCAWAKSVPSPARISKAVEDFRAIWPQWSWEWFAREASAAAAQNLSVSSILFKLAQSAGMTASNPALNNFLLSCGLIETESKSSHQQELPKDTVSTESRQTTLPALIMKFHKLRVSHCVKRFDAEGWFPVGRIDPPCPSCGIRVLEGFRRPYKNSKGDLYHYWGLYCPSCNRLMEPSDLPEESRKTLKQQAIPLNSRVAEQSVEVFAQTARSSAADDSSNDEYCTPELLTEGTRVRHWKWGVGVVVTFEQFGNERIAVVRFRGVGAKRLQLSVAKLMYAN